VGKGNSPIEKNMIRGMRKKGKICHKRKEREEIKGNVKLKWRKIFKRDTKNKKSG
jgi:hypothetical protein